MKFTVLFGCPNRKPQRQAAQVLRDLADQVEQGQLVLPQTPNQVHYHDLFEDGVGIGRAAFVAEPSLRNRLGQKH